MIIKKNKRDNAVVDQSLIDACKALFAKIGFAQVDKKIKTICVTSPHAAEGKSTTSVNLAIAIAGSGAKTLIIENDMRKRSVASALRVSGEHDLYDLLRGNILIEDAVVQTGYENLYFLDVAPGVPSPPDILGSDRYKLLIERLKERFDYIILDTPPVLLFVDAAIVASIADGTVLVVKEKTTKKAAAAKAIAQLKEANANIVGISMSCCRAQKDDYYYNYYDAETGKKIGRTQHLSSTIDLSELNRAEKPIWDVDYNTETIPENDDLPVPENTIPQEQEVSIRSGNAILTMQGRNSVSQGASQKLHGSHRDVSGLASVPSPMMADDAFPPMHGGQRITSVR